MTTLAKPPFPLALVEPGGQVTSAAQALDFHVYWTRNYLLFVSDPSNRVVFDQDGQARNVALEKSMRQRGYLPAAHIVVARAERGFALRVVEGHNRLEIARSLGEPVWFAVHPAEHHISPLQYSVSQKSWSFADRARSHGDVGDYAEVLKYAKELGVPERAAFNLFRREVAISTNNRGVVEAGLFEIKDRQMPEKIRFAVSQIGNPFAASRNCVCALSKVYLWSQSDFDALVVNFAKHPQLLKVQRTVEDYLDLFEKIFNFNRRGGPVPFKTEINRTMLERQRNFGKQTT